MVFGMEKEPEGSSPALALYRNTKAALPDGSLL
jgi:hypothetical protein